MAFQQCGANAAAMNCQGTHDPMRPIANYVRVIDLAAPASRHTGATNNIGAGGSTTVTPGTFFQQVTPQQADVSQPWAGSLEFYITPWGFLKGAAENNATVSRRRVNGTNYTVLTWSPAVKAPSGKAYVINGYVNGQQPRRARRDLARRQHHGRHAHRRHLHRMEGLRRRDGAGEDRADARRMAVLRGRRHGGEGEPARRRDAGAGTRAACRPRRRPPPAGGAGGGAAPALTVTPEKLGDGLYRLTTGAGSYDSLLVEFKDHVMMLEAGQSEARALAYIAETKKLFPNKPIRYVMNTHPHADHTGGLPAHGGRGRHDRHAEEQRGLLRAGAEHAANAADRHAGEEPEEGQDRGGGGEEGLFGWHAHGRAVPCRSCAALQRPVVAYIPKEKILFQGDFSLPGRRAAGQRSRQGSRAGAREAESGLRALYPGARARSASNESRPVEGGGQVGA